MLVTGGKLTRWMRVGYWREADSVDARVGYWREADSVDARVGYWREADSVDACWLLAGS